MKTLRQNISLYVRERVMQHYGVAFSRHGLTATLLPYLPDNEISLVDIGASAGEFAYGIMLRNGLKKALLVEPQPRRCDELRKRFANEKVTVQQCAVADQESTMNMDILNWDYSSSLLSVRRDIPTVSARMDLGVRERIECRVTKLDDLLRESGWQEEKIDLLKIDVQGAELLALKGSVETLHRTRLLFTEVSYRQLYEGSSLFSDVYEFLNAHDFRLMALGDAFRGTDGELLQSDAVFVRSAAHEQSAPNPVQHNDKSS